MKWIQNEEELDELLTRPSGRDIDAMRRLPGDILVVGAGGKMGPTLARLARRASDAAGVARKVMAASRFSSGDARKALEREGVETIACDLLNRRHVDELPAVENVLYLAGRKFGSTDRVDLTWATNTMAPANVAERYKESRIVVFSTGNVYSFVSTAQGGCQETDAPDPRGEYAQSSLGRERVFEYYSREFGTRCLMFRLNYAVDLRYGVLVDIARQVYAGEPVNAAVPAFNVVWQGDANSYALRSLEFCAAPPRVLNVTGPETMSVRRAAQFFGRRFGREVVFQGERSDTALLSDAGACHALMGYPAVPGNELMEWVARWVESGGASLNKPTKFQVTDGRF